MEELKRLRRMRGLSQAKLAALADLDPSTVSQIETGARRANSRTLERIAAALGVEVRDLFPLGQAPLPLEGQKDQVDGALVAEVDEAARQYLIGRVEKHDAEVRDPNSPHFATAQAATLWLASVEDEFASWLDWTTKELWKITIPASADPNEAVSDLVGRLLVGMGWVTAFDLLTDRAKSRIKAMNDAPDELAARRLEAASAAAEASRRQLDGQREAASG